MRGRRLVWSRLGGSGASLCLFGAGTPLDSGSKACINGVMLAENPGGPTTWNCNAWVQSRG